MLAILIKIEKRETKIKLVHTADYKGISWKMKVNFLFYHKK